MTRNELKKTAWAKRFKQEAPSEYKAAIDFAMTPDLDVIVYKDTIETHCFDKGLVTKAVWAVAISETDLQLDNSFWMDAFKLKKTAVALCKEMNWKIVK